MEEKEKKERHVYIRFPQSLYDKITQEAKNGVRSRGEQVMYYVIQAIEAENNTRERFRLFEQLEQSQAHMEEPGAEGRESNGTEDP